MILRACKTAFVFGVALYFTLVVFNNLSDYDANYQFVRHVLMMDSTFPESRSMWRALNSPAWHTAFYWTIIVWELAAMVLCWWGGLRLTKALRTTPGEFRRAKDIAVAGLAVGLLLWLVPFLIVGGEWFLMWQSRTWNGQEAAFRMITAIGMVLLFLVLPEADSKS
jgi:predicted small integral membrane protein